MMKNRLRRSRRLPRVQILLPSMSALALLLELFPVLITQTVRVPVVPSTATTRFVVVVGRLWRLVLVLLRLMVMVMHHWFVVEHLSVYERLRLLLVLLLGRRLLWWSLLRLWLLWG